MMVNLSNAIVSNPFLGIGAILVAYIADYYQTLRGARLYQKGANQVIEIEGSYELNPLFASDIDRLTRVSPRFIIVLLIYSIFIGAVWYIFVPFLGVPQMYTFALGAVLLLQGPIQVRHVRNITAFKHARTGESITGRIAYSRRFSYTASATEFISFAGLYLVLALLTSSWLLAGGAFGCAVLALRHYRIPR